jgi:hypothetical protein
VKGLGYSVDEVKMVISSSVSEQLTLTVNTHVDKGIEIPTSSVLGFFTG